MKKTMLSTKQSYLVCFIGILAAFGIVMALCESGLADSYIKGIMMTACIAIIMTTSLNLTIGVLGQLTLGCCGFEAIGAYVAALTSKYMVAAGIAIDPTARFLLTTLIGGVVACVFGILIGIPALRLHGDYLAIITLGFGEIIRVIIQNLKVAGGMGLDKGAAGQALIGIERTANLYVVFWIMVLRAFADYRMLAYSVVLVLVMIFRPQGIFGSWEFSLPRLVNRMLFRGAAGKGAKPAASAKQHDQSDDKTVKEASR